MNYSECAFMKTALISGSSSGIGKATSEHFLKKGFRVVGLARDHHKFDCKLRNFIPVEVDLSNVEKLSISVKKIVKSHPKISTFVSNAGFGDFRALENFSDVQIYEFLKVNLISHIVLCKILVSHMKKHKEGNIFLMGSEAALNGKKYSTLYSAAKFGLRGFAQSLREEAAGSGIKICVINPGTVRTPFFDKLTFEPSASPCNAIEPHDIAKVIFELQNIRSGTIVDEINLSPAVKSINFKK